MPDPKLGVTAPLPSPKVRPGCAALPLPRRLDSETLLAGQSEIEIIHAGTVYRLRLTSLGKLILTK